MNPTLADRWLSGRKRPPAKWVGAVKAPLGFESRSVRHLLTAASLLGAAVVSHAQSLPEYLKLRKTYGIARAVSPDALDAIVGKRVVEIAGIVKGTSSVGGTGSVHIEVGAETYVVDATNLPEWIGRGEVRARLIVQANRPTALDQPTFRLVGAAPEEDVARTEAAAPKVASAKVKAAPTTRSSRRTSRSTPVASRSKAGRNWSLPASQVLPHYSAFIRKVNPRLTRAQSDDMARGVIGFSLKYGVDARLIVAMVMVESDFDPNCVSSAGAQGLGQLMPGTARMLGVRNSHDPMENLYGTVRYMRDNLNRYGSSHKGLVLSIAAYNAGPGAVKRHGGVPPYRETQRYVQKVLAIYRRLCGV